MGNQTEPRSIVTPGWAGESPILGGRLGADTWARACVFLMVLFLRIESKDQRSTDFPAPLIIIGSFKEWILSEMFR